MTEHDSQELSAAKLRILNSALKLFSQHGVAGTSLQMIADDIGVTKAAVYHQFNTKDEIVVAASILILSPLEKIIEQAMQAPESKRRQVLIDGLIEQAVEKRQYTGLLQQDPVILRLFDEHERFRNMMTAFDRILIGDKNSASAKVATAFALTAIGSTVLHPLIRDVDDDSLRQEMRKLLRGPLRQLN